MESHSHLSTSFATPARMGSANRTLAPVGSAVTGETPGVERVSGTGFDRQAMLRLLRREIELATWARLLHPSLPDVCSRRHSLVRPEINIRLAIYRFLSALADMSA